MEITTTEGVHLIAVPLTWVQLTIIQNALSKEDLGTAWVRELESAQSKIICAKEDIQEYAMEHS